MVGSIAPGIVGIDVAAQALRQELDDLFDLLRFRG